MKTNLLNNNADYSGIIPLQQVKGRMPDLVLKRYSKEYSFMDKSSKLMKTLLIICMVIFSSNLLFSQEQNQNDESLVLQKCIDMVEIQSYFPQNDDGTYKQVHILQFPFAFSQDLGNMKFGQAVLFQSRADIFTANPDAFLSYSTFSINGNTAEVVFDFNYNRQSNSSSIIKISVSLEKSSDNWNIVNKTLNN